MKPVPDLHWMRLTLFISCRRRADGAGKDAGQVDARLAALRPAAQLHAFASGAQYESAEATHI